MDTFAAAFKIPVAIAGALIYNAFNSNSITIWALILENFAKIVEWFPFLQLSELEVWMLIATIRDAPNLGQVDPLTARICISEFANYPMRVSIMKNQSLLAEHLNCFVMISFLIDRVGILDTRRSTLQ